MLEDGEFTYHLTPEEYDFLEDLADYLRSKGKPPPLKASSHVPCAGLFYVPGSISVDAPEGGEENDYFGLGDFNLQEDILRLIDSGKDNIWMLDICLPEESFGDIRVAVNRLIGSGVIREEGGNLNVNYADLSMEEFAPVEKNGCGGCNGFWCVS